MNEEILLRLLTTGVGVALLSGIVSLAAPFLSLFLSVKALNALM